jgi:antitoxin VapB
MSMNIKSEQAHQLARELAQRTGESLTQAVTVALQERLERVGGHRPKKATAEELMALGRAFAAQMPESFRHEDFNGFLYDEWGLPK